MTDYPSRGMSAPVFWIVGVIAVSVIPCCIGLALLFMTGFCTTKLKRVQTKLSEKMFGKAADPWAEPGVVDAQRASSLGVEEGEGGLGSLPGSAPATPAARGSRGSYGAVSSGGLVIGLSPADARLERP